MVLSFPMVMMDWGDKLQPKLDGTCHYSLEYDKMGNVTQSVDHLTDRMTKRTYNHFGDLLHETLGNKIYLKRAYDSLSRCVELQFPDESKVLYLYDPYHLISVKRFDSFGVECYEHTYDQYDHSHNLISEFHPGSLGPAFHQIDLMSRRIQTDAIYSTEKIVEIDPNGNVLKYHRHFNDEDEITEYQYDDLDQLTNETGRFAHQYTYDSHYNRIQKDDANYAIDTLHQLQSTSDTSYEHDPNGNRIATLKDTHEVHYSYDGLDRLTQIHSGNKAVNYSYDSWEGAYLELTFHSKKESGLLHTPKTFYTIIKMNSEIIPIKSASSAKEEELKLAQQSLSKQPIISMFPFMIYMETSLPL